jgi:putative ABC transport system permease protein
MSAAARAALRLLALAQWREQPLRVLLTLLVVALGVALSSAVYLINAGALGEFSQATRRLVGEADLIIRGGDAGFDERVLTDVARRDGVQTASAVVALDVALPGREQPLRLLGIDPLRAGQIQPQLLGDVAGQLFELFEPDAVLLSRAAAEWLGVRSGDRFEVGVGDSTRRLRVIGLLATQGTTQRLAIMDIASAQWLFGRLGRIDRIDLRLARGADGAKLRRELSAALPAGVSLVEPAIERDRAVTVTRAYRVNLNMLALVSLLTGAFLVFSTQSLAVLRRRQALGLLRALGLRRAELQSALLAEGLLLGALGALLGVCLGQLLAWGVLEWLQGDLGAGMMAVGGIERRVAWGPVLAFFALGTAIASAGAWAPALEASRRAPALALRAGDAEPALTRLRRLGPSSLLLAVGIGLALLPATSDIPLFGYSAIAALLLAAVLAVPRVAAALLGLLPQPSQSMLALAIARLRGSLGQSTVSLAAIIVSFSLMVAMAIMVYSFRLSFDAWLTRTLPAPLQWRMTPGNDTARLDSEAQARMRAIEGVTAVQWQRSQQLLLDARRAPVTLVARDVSTVRDAEDDPTGLALTPVATATATAPLAHSRHAWVSEAMLDLYGSTPGSTLLLPLDGREVPFSVAGVFRDFGRSTGTVVIDRADYIALTGDASANEGAVWIAPNASLEATREALRAVAPGLLDVRGSDDIRRLSMRAFDRAFAITYALEFVAVAIGLLAIGFASSSNALARRAEFGMLRHLGLRRRDVLSTLAGEGLLMGALGVVYGLAVGLGLSLVLVHVVNRQSFHWSVDLALPGWQLAAVSALLVIAAAATSTWAGRRALRGDAVRAVREDW